MALTTRTIRISLRFPTAQSTATVRFIPDLSAGNGQVLLEKYYDATLGTSITAASNLSPIVITTAADHGYVTGDVVTIAGVLGNTAANGTWTITKTGETTFSLNGSTGNGTYTSGGTLSCKTIYGTINLPVFISAENYINYRVQFPRESGFNEHYISVNSGGAIDLSDLLVQSLVAAAGYTLDLSALSDVTITTPASGQYLRYNGTEWVNSAVQVGDLPASVMLKTTYDTDTDGVVDKTAQVVMTVRNDAGTTLAVGEVVYVSGASGEHVKVKRALGTTDLLSASTLGMVIEEINNGADGKIALHGVVTGVDTNAFNEGQSLYVSTTVAGGLTNTRPVPPKHAVFVGYVTKKSGNGKVALHIQNGYELEELHDVLITSPTSGQVLSYDGSLWKNTAAPLTIGGSVSGGGANRVLFQDASQNLASNSGFTFDASTSDLTVDLARIGALTDGAAFGHKNYFTHNSYAVLQDAVSGSTYINAAAISPAFGKLYFRVNNSRTHELNFDGEYWQFRYGDSTYMNSKMNSDGKFEFNVYGSTPRFYFNGKIDTDGSIVVSNNGYIRAGSAAMSKVLIERLNSSGQPIAGTIGGAGFAYFDYDGATTLNYLSTDQYAIQQDMLGNTYVNAGEGWNPDTDTPTNGRLYLRNQNSLNQQMVFDGAYWNIEQWTYASSTWSKKYHMSMEMATTGIFKFNVYADAGVATPKFYFNGATDFDGNVVVGNNGYLRAGSAAISKVLIQKLDSNGNPLSGTVGGGGFAYFDYDGATTLNYLNTTDYAIQQDVYGNTYVNAGAGWNPATDTVTAGRLYLRNANSKNQQIAFDGAYWNIEQWNADVKQYHMSMRMASTGVFEFHAYNDAGAATPSFYFNGKMAIEGNVELGNLGEFRTGSSAMGEVDGDAAFAFRGYNGAIPPVLVNHLTDTNYAIRQDASGNTYVNAAIGGRLYLGLNNDVTYGLNFDGEYWTHWYNQSTKMSTKMNADGKFEFNVYKTGGTPYFYFNGLIHAEGDIELGNNGEFVTGVGAFGNTAGDMALAFRGFSPSASPVDNLTATNYALRQDYLGNSHLNASSTGNVYIRKNNGITRQMVFDGTYWYFEYGSGIHFSTTVDNNGVTTFNAAGSTPKFVFSDDVEVPDEAYGAGWNGSTEVPTKNAVYDKIESLGSGLPSLTSGSVVFSGGGTTFSQDNANFFWDDSNNRLGVGTNAPASPLDVKGGFSTAQMRLTYDSNNYLESRLSGSAVASFTVTGGVGQDPRFTFNERIIIDNPAGGPTATPLALDLGYDYGTNAAGSVSNIKLLLQNDAGSIRSGLGVTETSTDVISDQDIVFYAQATASTKAERMRIKNNAVAVGIGTGSPSAALHVRKTTEQLRVGYDASNYYTTTVNSAGLVTFDTTGVAFKFDNAVRIDATDGEAQLRLDNTFGTANLAFEVYDDNVIELRGENATEFRFVNLPAAVFQNGIEQTAIKSRTTTVTSGSAPTPNVDTTDIYSVTALGTAATFGAPTGTPVNGQKLLIRIKDNGTARTLNWNAAYVAGGASLPTTTVINKTMHLGFIYNADNGLNKWMLIAKAEEA